MDGFMAVFHRVLTYVMLTAKLLAPCYTTIVISSMYITIFCKLDRI
jgi:hypothetical protein